MIPQRIHSIDEGVRIFRETSGALLLDVRTPEEYSAGHIPGSVNVPLDELHSFNEDAQTLFVYCRSGNRSSRAAALLQKMDYEAVNIGGILDYTGQIEK